MNCLILIADPDEYAPFIAQLEHLGVTSSRLRVFPCSHFKYKGECTVVCTYIGKVNSAVACCAALSSQDYDAVISLGYSGAVTGLMKGDYAAGKTYTECDFDLTPIGYAPGEKIKGEPFVHPADSRLLQAALTIPGIKTASFGTGDFFLTDKALRDRYKQQFGIGAFDMETGAIANVCSMFGVPFVAVRKISDNADDAASSEYGNIIAKREKAFSDILTSLLDALSI